MIFTEMPCYVRTYILKTQFVCIFMRYHKPLSCFACIMAYEYDKNSFVKSNLHNLKASVSVNN